MSDVERLLAGIEIMTLREAGQSIQHHKEDILAAVRKEIAEARAQGGLEVLNTTLAGCSDGYKQSFPACTHHGGLRECAIGRRERLKEAGDG